MKNLAGTPVRARTERIFGAPALAAPASKVSATTRRRSGGSSESCERSRLVGKAAACRCATSRTYAKRPGWGKLSKSTASRICEELKERFDAFKRRDLYEVWLIALFLDATFIAVRPDGPKEGVLVAWGFCEDGERVLLAVSLGIREPLRIGRRLAAT
jgi:Transposase, Mutator family